MENTWYNIATIIISFLSLFGFGAVMKYFWEDKRAKRKENTEEAKKTSKRRKAGRNKRSPSRRNTALAYQN